jgi:hypothetical protein
MDLILELLGEGRYSECLGAMSSAAESFRSVHHGVNEIVDEIKASLQLRCSRTSCVRNNLNIKVL